MTESKLVFVNQKYNVKVKRQNLQNCAPIAFFGRNVELNHGWLDVSMQIFGNLEQPSHFWQPSTNFGHQA